MSQDAAMDSSALAASLRSDLTSMRAEFHQVLDGLVADDLTRPTSNVAWSVGEQLMHIVYWLRYTPTAVDLVRHPTSVRSRIARAVPAVLFDRLNIVLTRVAARHQTQQTIAARYELAYQVALKTLERIRDDEWARGAHFAAYQGEYRTVATIFRSDVTHQATHLDEIRRSLALQSRVVVRKRYGQSNV